MSRPCMGITSFPSAEEQDDEESEDDSVSDDDSLLNYLSCAPPKGRIFAMAADFLGIFESVENILAES